MRYPIILSGASNPVRGNRSGRWLPRPRVPPDGYSDVKDERLSGYLGDPSIRARGLAPNAKLADRDRCMEVGMDSWVTKPFRLGDLERVLAEVTKPSNN